jgi:hypothetical protein
LAYLVLLARLRDVPKRDHTEEPKLRVLVGGEPDQPKPALGGHGHSGRGRTRRPNCRRSALRIASFALLINLP